MVAASSPRASQAVIRSATTSATVMDVLGATWMPCFYFHFDLGMADIGFLLTLKSLYMLFAVQPVSNDPRFLLLALPGGPLRFRTDIFIPLILVTQR
jgi:hypothetical protein